MDESGRPVIIYQASQAKERPPFSEGAVLFVKTTEIFSNLRYIPQPILRLHDALYAQFELSETDNDLGQGCNV